MPCKRMLRITIEENLEETFQWNNIFTSKDYISQAIETSGIILGQDKPDYFNIKLDFCQYFQVYENTRNDMTPRSVDGIVIRHKIIGNYTILCHLR